jgi:RNA-binding protein YlmH
MKNITRGSEIKTGQGFVLHITRSENAPVERVEVKVAELSGKTATVKGETFEASFNVDVLGMVGTRIK